MTGLLLLAVVGLWVWLVFKASKWVGQQVKTPRWRIPLAVLAFVALLVLPVADEIVGKWQFESLCKQYAVQTIDEQHARNARVISVGGRDDWHATGTAVSVRIQPWIYRDATTQKVLVSYHTLHAEGGFLIRTLGISETNSPLLFPRSCAPSDERAFIKKFNIVITN